jgi:biotin carboxylase
MSTLVLFKYDWDDIGFARHQGARPFDTAGFDLFSFPSNARLVWFDTERFVARLARQARARGWTAVVSNQEHFGALAAALLAERMGWPGTPVQAVLACQHKLYARQLLQQVCPEANCSFAALDARYGEPIAEQLPAGLQYPVFVKPVKAAFSVLARTVQNRAELHAHTRFGRWELWVIRHLVEPFERLAQARLPQVSSAHKLLLEQPIAGQQYNLDGYVFQSEVHAIGVVDAVHYPGTQAFMRFELPSRLRANVQARALDVARRFLNAAGFSHGLFNMEFFYEEQSKKLTVIEFNPRMASQFSDLYLQVSGVDMHAIALALAAGRDPASLPKTASTAGAAASFVYRELVPSTTPATTAFTQLASARAQPVRAQPGRARIAALKRLFPQSLLFCFPKSAGQIARDFKWLGSYRYGILHLYAANAAQLEADCRSASACLQWPAPYASHDTSHETSHSPTPDRV